MTPRELELLKEAFSIEEIDLGKIKHLIIIQAKKGEISPMLQDISTAILAHNDKLLEYECHMVRSIARFCPVKYVEYSRGWLKHNPKPQ